jgi:hypothetical protein
MLNEAVYNKFLSDGDYIGAANYLSRAHFTDTNKQQLVNQTIKDLRTEGRKMMGIMSNANADQRAAYSFVNAVNNNDNLPGLNNGKDSDGDTIGASNTYSKDYSTAIRQMGSTAAHEAESISIKFGAKTEKRYGLFGIDWLAKDKEYKEDAFTEMLHRTGLTEQALKKAGAKVEMKNGQYVLNISKRNSLFSKVYNGLLDIKSDDDLYRFQIAGIDAKGKLISTKDRSDNPKDDLATKVFPNKRTNLKDYSSNDYSDTITKESFSPSWNDLNPFSWKGVSHSDYDNDDDYYYNPARSLELKGNFTDANTVVQTAQNNINKLINKSSDNKDGMSTVSSMTLNFNSARRKDISDYLNAGRINASQATALINENNNAILNGIMQSDMTQYDMYSTDEDEASDGNTTRKHITDTKERAKIQDLIRAAIRNGKFDVDTQVSLAMQGDQTGYVITLPATIDKANEKGNELDDVSEASRSIFIPNFMNGEAEKVFANNTKTRAMKELASMELYNYGVDIPQEGKLKVYNNPDTGTPVYQMEYSSGDVRNMTKDDALRQVNKMLIVEDGIDNANKMFYDEDGNIRNSIKVNGKINPAFQQDLTDRVNAYVTSAMSELYPQAWQSFRPFASAFVNGDINNDEYRAKLAKAMESFIDVDNINLINAQRAIYSSYILNSIGANDADAYNIE